MDTSRLFHGSLRNLDAGEFVMADKPTDYFPEVAKIYDSVRPEKKPGRSICKFASDSIVGAAVFMKSQTNRSFKVYVVEMVDFHRGPFRVTHEINRRLKAGEPYDALVEEYWVPKATWGFYEYFGPSFVVIGEEPRPNSIQEYAFRIRHFNDLELAFPL